MRSLKLIATVALMSIVAACASEPAPPAAETAPGTSLPAPDTIEYFNQVVGDRVFFATDQHVLDSAAQATLRAQAQWLLTNAGTTAVIEGHADERGTRAYNLALGARRANSAYRFLIAEGVPAGRLRTVTYGKERPVANCSNETCWSQNRRSVTVVAGAPSS